MEVILLLFAMGLMLITEKKRKKEAYLRNKVFGDVGESKVKQILSSLPPEYIVENDVCIGGCQIDHIVRYKNIVIVIETKYWGGTILTSKNKYWMQGGKPLYNPFKQNSSHTHIVGARQPFSKVYGVVCFVGQARLVGDCSRAVVHCSELREKIFQLTDADAVHNR